MTGAVEEFLADIAGIAVATDDATIKLKSRDFFWFSPILKPQLETKRARAIVRPANREELRRIMASACRHRVALTTRGGGTGNYGQSVPLDGGIVIETTGLDRLLANVPGLVTVEAGKMMLDIDREIESSGFELRMFPSTRQHATIGGFVCGGAAGVGSCTWGQIGDPGAVQALRLMTMEEEPRELRLEGDEVMQAVHAYGVNGVVTEIDLPTAPRFPWAEQVIAFPTLIAAASFGQGLIEDQVIAKKLVSVHAPGISPYLKRIAPLVGADEAFAIIMTSEPQRPSVRRHITRHGGRMAYERDSEAARRAAFFHDGAMPPLYEYCWNHTTLHAIRLDPSITYLQVLFPAGRNIERLAWAESAFAGEIFWHLEFQRRLGTFTNSSLPLVKFTTPERLFEIMAILEDNGLQVANPHIFTLEGKGWKRIKADQEGLKRQSDPYFLLNPGRLPSLEEAHRRQAAE